jgi:hypothetical protein
VPVELAACTAVAGRGAGVGVAGGDSGLAQGDSGVERR